MLSLTYGLRVGDAEDPLRVGFILGEQQRSCPFAIEVLLPQFGVTAAHHHRPFCLERFAQRRSVGDVISPGPLVAKPERRQDVQFGGLGTAVVDADLNQQIFGRFLGVLHEDVEVAVLVEHARIKQFVLQFLPRPLPACFNEVVRTGYAA